MKDEQQRFAIVSRVCNFFIIVGAVVAIFASFKGALILAGVAIAVSVAGMTYRAIASRRFMNSVPDSVIESFRQSEYGAQDWVNDELDRRKSNHKRPE
ncbi:hypothetical protein FG152_24540 [Ochrobactrum sp. XJ1]|nr:hypothetical protein [Ochrobactrum sp. XJ1]